MPFTSLPETSTFALAAATATAAVALAAAATAAAAAAAAKGHATQLEHVPQPPDDDSSQHQTERGALPEPIHSVRHARLTTDPPAPDATMNTADLEDSVGAAPLRHRVASDRSNSHSDEAEMEDADQDVDDAPKKKRRVIKTSEKKYECPQPECGKSYSRAEHLYRHQLNRA